MPKDSLQPALWNKNFTRCCFSYFLMSFAFYMLMPTIPVYLTEVLEITPSQIGLALSSYTVGLLCVRPFSGYLVDIFPRKKLYLFSFLAFSCVFTGYLFISTTYGLMLVRFIQGGFMGLASVAGNTITIDVIPSQRRGEGMGFYGVTLNLSMSLSPVIALILYESYGFHPMILVAIGTALTGVISVMLINYPHRQPIIRKSLSLDRFILIKALPSAFSYVLSAIPYGMIISFVVLYGKESGVSNPGYFFIGMSGGVALSRILSGKLIDKGHVHAVALSSLAGLTISFLLFSLVHTTTTYFLSSLLIGISFGTSIPAFQYIFVNVAPADQRGTATSTYLTSFDVGVGSGTLIAGFITSHYDFQTTFIIGTVCCFLSLLTYRFISYPAYKRNKLTY